MREHILDSTLVSAAHRSVRDGLSPLVLIVFLGFLAIGVPLSALAFQVHDGLGFGAVTVGVVLGIQSAATVLTRHWAGTRSDERGPRWAVLVGLPLAAASGLFYAASALIPVGPEASLALLVLGRLAIGLGESLFAVGAMAWGIGRIGPSRTGAVMSWQGIAMFAALGLGAPIGLALQATYGFAAVALFTLATPTLAFGLAWRLEPVPASGGDERVPFHRVLGLIWRPGLVLTLSAIPFTAMGSFLALVFAARGWPGAGLALLGFSTAYVLVRLVGPHWPDRFGGVRTAAVSLGIEALGQALLCLAPNAAVAASAAFLTGLGFSLVFPAMGVEATGRVPQHLRGRAVGNFIAFADIAMGLTGPVVGLLVARFGFESAFLAGLAASLAALCMIPAVKRMGAAP